MPEWRNRIVGTGEEDPTQLVANARNWRIHPKEQQRALEAVLNEVGWVDHVIVNQTTGAVVDGHLRVELAIARNEPHVPVQYVELTEDEEALILASIDPLAAMAATDAEKLRELLEDIDIPSDDLAAFLSDIAGMDPPKPTEGLIDDDTLPGELGDIYVKPGDVWVLGEHRVMCGDSTDPDQVIKLLGGGKPNIMVTDPPYGVEYSPEWRNEALGKANRRLGKVTNDDRADWREAWFLFRGDVAYVWHAALSATEVATSLAVADLKLRSQIIWVKPQLVPGRSDYQWKHEVCWYAIREGGKAHWASDRKQTTVWEIDHLMRRQSEGDDAWTEHGTQKPVECMARAVRNHEGDVYDPFIGSGSTLIAAQKYGRRCYGMDIEAEYVQIVIERWKAYTGEEPHREEDDG